MTIQEVIESYNIINTSLPMILIIFGSMVFVFGLGVVDEINDKKKISKLQKGILVVTFIGFSMIIFGLYQGTFENPKEIMKWKEIVRKEYVNKLPIEKIEVLDYKGIGQKVNENQLKIEFTYLNQNVLTMDTVVATIKTVKGLKQPYLEYQYIEKNLPQTSNEVIFKKGYHNPVLYIPEQ